MASSSDQNPTEDLTVDSSSIDQFAELRAEQMRAVIASQDAQLAFYAATNGRLKEENRRLAQQVELLDRFRRSARLAAGVIATRAREVLLRGVRRQGSNRKQRDVR